MQKGTIGVTTENIFPIIKQFLYSDREIFLREIVSNAVDATQKLKTLASKGDFKGEMGDLTVHVTVGKDTITVSDRGIGMTAAEIDTMTRRVQAAVYEEHRIVLATVGIYSRNTTDDAVVAMRSAITRAVMAHDEVLQMHGFYVDAESKRVSFDVIIDFAAKDREGLYQQIVEEVQALYPDYAFAIALDRDLSD